MNTCPTVKIVSDAAGAEGFVVINAVDFDDSIHTKFDPSEDETARAPPPKPPSKAELAEELTALKVEFDPGLKHAELLALRDSTVADRLAAAAAANAG